MALLVKGNNKLGNSIWQFSIPAGSTNCPGRSELCDDRCYAQRGMFAMPNVQASLRKRLAASKRKDFVQKMIEEILRVKARTIRVSVSGDFYSPEYVRKWHEIVKSTPETVYFTYTRSWRVPEIYEELKAFARLKNLRLWFSVDQETGIPPKIPKNVRLAYMQVDIKDVPSHKMDLVFRDYPIRGSIHKYINGVQVCPPENGVTELTCEKCGICYSNRVVKKGLPDKNIRMQLQLVA